MSSPQDFETNDELRCKVISFLEEVMHDPELLTQERKAAANIIRWGHLAELSRRPRGAERGWGSGSASTDRQLGKALPTGWLQAGMWGEEPLVAGVGRACTPLLQMPPQQLGHVSFLPPPT